MKIPGHMHHKPLKGTKILDHQTYVPPCVQSSQASMCRPLTKVDVVVASPLPVHLVYKEAGDGLEEQAENSHAHAEAICIPAPLRQSLVKDSKVDNVCQDGHKHPQEELLGKMGRCSRVVEWKRIWYQ